MFSSSHILRHKRRAASRFSDYDFLYRRAALDLKDRAADIRRTFSSVLLAGFWTARVAGDIFPGAETLEDLSPETLTERAGRYDCIVVLGELHHAEDLPGLLIQIRRALKPDGVFLAAFPGGETLKELRETLLESEMRVSGGASPRVYPFVASQQAADLMQRAGFALPVVDSDSLTVSYRDMFHLFSDLRGMGETNALAKRHRALTPSRLFFDANATYAARFPAKEPGRVDATYETLFVIGWAPHDSQQQPARRGSGQIPLGEVL